MALHLQAEYWNTVILGIVVLALGIWSAMLSTAAARQGEATPSTS